MKARKKILSLLLAGTLISANLPIGTPEVYAAGEAAEPNAAQFATEEQLKTYKTDTAGASAKVYFGKDDQQWWIAGEENGNIVLFAASPLATGIRFNVNGDEKNFDASWGCTYPNGSNIQQVNANHYGGSDIRNGNKAVNPENPGLAGLLKSCFTEAERGLMNATTVHTQDTANSNVAYSTTDKLYLANGSMYASHVSVGASNNLKIDITYWGSDSFWLRAPYAWNVSYALRATPNDAVSFNNVDSGLSVVPAFNFNLSSVSFASAALPATGDGKLTVKTVNDANQEGAFTLRHSSTNVGDAKVSAEKKSVSISNVSTNPAVNTYLVVQNSEGAWAKKVSNGDIIFADEVSSSLTSFEKCKVWLETTDSTTRMTSAKMAEEATTQSSHNVKVKLGDHMSITSGNGKQTGVSGQIDEIMVTADSGYYFPTDYSVEAVNGISVDRTSDTTLKISGKPTADTLLTLTAATAKTNAPQPTLSVDNITRTKNSLSIKTDGFNIATYGAIQYQCQQADANTNTRAVEWTEGTEISGLQAGTAYTIAIRYKGTDRYLPSEPSKLTISTLEDTGNTDTDSSEQDASDPDTDNEITGSGKNQSNTVGPRTGDNNSIALWIALMLIALAVGGSTVSYGRRKRAR